MSGSFPLAAALQKVCCSAEEFECTNGAHRKLVRRLHFKDRSSSLETHGPPRLGLHQCQKTHCTPLLPRLEPRHRGVVPGESELAYSTHMEYHMMGERDLMGSVIDLIVDG